MPIHLAGILQQQGAGGGGAFDVENDITWHSLFWAEGTTFTAPSDGADVTTWDNEVSGEVDLDGTGHAPSYSAAVANLNSQPAIDFDGSNEYMQTLAFNTSLSGLSVVVVANFDTVGNFVFDDTNTTNRVYVNQPSGTAWRVHAGGTNQEAGTPATGAQLLVVNYDGSSGVDELDVNGTNVVSGNAGSNIFDALTVGAAQSGAGEMNGQIALFGLYDGDVRDDAEWSNFTSWVNSHYGITVA